MPPQTRISAPAQGHEVDTQDIADIQGVADSDEIADTEGITDSGGMRRRSATLFAPDRVSRVVRPPRWWWRRAQAAPVTAMAGLFLVLTVLLGGVLAGCSGTGDGTGVTVVDVGGADGDSSSGLRGTELPVPLDKPALGLVGTDGKPFDLRERTAGKVTLLFFGFTNCPDVCPTTMADIASALAEVDPAVRSQVAVVFVTTDPERDTGDVIDRWLRQFDETFIGVTGPLEGIHAEAERLDVPVANPEKQPDGSFLVTHGSQVIAFTKDDKSRVVYLAGTQVADYMHDLPILTGVGAAA